MDKYTKYVLGFLFSKDCQTVVLIRKNKPEWQKGLYNGVGGKIEEDEEPIAAMQREFLEETGIDIDTWISFAVMKGEEFECHCYVAFSENAGYVRAMTSEQVKAVSVQVMLTEGKGQMIPNLSWLIPMALDAQEFKADIYYF